MEVKCGLWRISSWFSCGYNHIDSLFSVCAITITSGSATHCIVVTCEGFCSVILEFCCHGNMSSFTLTLFCYEFLVYSLYFST